MQLKKINSSRVVNVNVSKYLVKWEGKCRSKFQFEVKQWFKKYWVGQIILEELLIPGSRMTCDIVNLTQKLVVEVSGEQHIKFNKYFHLNSRQKYLEQIQRDVSKQQWAEDNGFKFIEIFPADMPLTREFFQEKYDVSI